MESKKKLLIFPFNIHNAIIARYARLLKGYELTAAVAPKNYGYDGSDISRIAGGNAVGMTVTADFSEELARCDSVLLTGSSFRMTSDFYLDKMKEAADSGKEVIITGELAARCRSGQKAIPTGVKIIGGNPQKAELSYEHQQHVREITVPVIMIVQLGSWCNGFRTLLSLAEIFECHGYRTCKVSSGGFSQLFGVHGLPDYISQPHMSDEDKIINMNHFLDKTVKEEEPDLLLLEIEEAVLPYNNRMTNHFGLIPLLMGKAVQPDIGILNMYNTTYDKEYLDHLRQYCRYALNTEVRYINIAHTAMQVNETDQREPVTYVVSEQERVSLAVRKDYAGYEGSMFFTEGDSAALEAVYYDVVNTLTQNDEIVRIW